MKSILLIIFSGLCPLFVSRLAHAQDTCAVVLREAEQKYFFGDFAAALSLAEPCLNKNGLADSTVVWAYKLLGMTYLARNDSIQATRAIENLLNRRPDYAPDPVQEPPSYVKFVNQIKQRLQRLTQQPSQSPNSTSSGANPRRSLKPWIAGGVLAGVTILVVLWPIQ